MSVEVSLVRCSSYDEEEAGRALREVLAPLGGLDWVSAGMKIVIKANLVSFKSPEAAATTHPALLCALVKELLLRGAEVVVGDSPGGLYNNAYVSRIYSATGMAAVEKAGAALNRDFSEAERDFPEGMVAKHLKYTAYLDHADAIINFCKLKTHGMMAMSAAAKNMFGVIPGTIKPEYHFRYPDPMDFARMIVDIDRCFPCRLCLVDGIVGMEGNGPTAGTPKKMDVLLASASPHKLDLICAKLIGLKKEKVPTLLAAHELGLIPDTAEEVITNCPPEDFIVPDFQNIENLNELLSQDGNAALWGLAASQLFGKVMASHPRACNAECIGCRECEKVCPAKAIVMKQERPVIDRGKCIRCFCCQEFCPKGAMKVHRPLLARLLNNK